MVTQCSQKNTITRATDHKEKEVDELFDKESKRIILREFNEIQEKTLAMQLERQFMILMKNSEIAIIKN